MIRAVTFNWLELKAGGLKICLMIAG